MTSQQVIITLISNFNLLVSTQLTTLIPDDARIGITTHIFAVTKFTCVGFAGFILRFASFWHVFYILFIMYKRDF